MIRLFRRGAHHQTGYRPTVGEIAAGIKRQAHRPVWTTEIRNGQPIWVWRGTAYLNGVTADRVSFTIAPPGGIATLPVLPTVPANPGVMADA